MHTSVVRVEVPRGGSVQDAARGARYAALNQAAQELQAKAVLVAHTADDQAETVLLNLLRGSGLVGLAAMRTDEQRPGRTRLVRPLLRVARSITLAYCRHFGLDIVEDVSNQSRAYTRNRVRLDLLPALERFNPSIRDVLARTADLAVEDNAVLDKLAASLDGQLRDDDTGDRIYDLRGFRDQPRALQRRVLRLAVQATLSGLRDVTDAPIEDALDLLQTGQANQTYHLPYGVELLMRTDTFTLRQGGRARQRQQKNLETAVSRV